MRQPPGAEELLARTRVVKTETPKPQRLSPVPVFEGHEPTTPMPVCAHPKPPPTTPRPVLEGAKPTTPRPVFGQEPTREVSMFEGHEPTVPRSVIAGPQPITPRSVLAGMELARQIPVFETLEPTTLRPGRSDPTVPRSAFADNEPVSQVPRFEALEPTTLRAAVEVLEPTVMRAAVEVLEPTVMRAAVEVLEPTVIWTRSRTPAPSRVRGPTPPHARLPPPLPPGVARGPTPGGPPPVPGLARGSSPAPLGLTPLLEREVFQLARRIALQADLPAATRVLQHGLSRLTDSPDAMCVLFDPSLCSAWALPDGNPPRAIDDQAQQLVAQVARTGQRAVLGHALVEPVGPVPARAVLVVRRPPAGAAYGGFEIATLAAIAAAVVGILGHFVADHGARREQELRDARSPFRPEALAERRGAVAAPGRVVTTPRTWMRWAYPTLIGLVVAVVAAAAIVQVPAYSTGVAIITVEGEHVTSPMPGTVAEVLVAPNARVAVGDPIVRLHALEEEAELAATEADYRNALAVFLTNPRDDGARGALATIATRRQRARTVVDARTLRARTAGIAGDIRVRVGQLVIPGAPVMKISERAEPSVVALLPGTDRPRLEAGMTLQIELPGFHKRREEAMIDSIGSQVIGPEEARRSLGDPIGDALPIMGPVVIVRAHLTGRTFEAGGREYEFHDGMLGKAEVKVDHESLLGMLLPGSGD